MLCLRKRFLVHGGIQWTMQQRALFWVWDFYLKHHPAPAVNRITCWVNTLHECPGKVKGKRSDWNLHKEQSTAAFAFHSRGIRTREKKQTQTSWWEKKKVRARTSDLLNKADCNTGVLGAFTQQCAAMRAAAAALLCNFNLCNTPTTYTHSV